jgi:type VI secretion system protein ImpE
MNAQDLFRAGKLKEAIQALGVEVRDHPTDARRRTFLFELLCFAGEYERAGKHLNILAQGSPDAEVGALLYRSALAAERQRQSMFLNREYPAAAASKSRPGTLNGKPFQTLEDADPRIGPRLEVFVAGEYVWLPFEFVGSIKMDAPRKLRDLMWAAAQVVTGPAFKDRDFGEVLLPVLSPLSWQHPSDDVKLGRATDWQEIEGSGAVPVGQKLLVVDGEEAIPFLEIRDLQFAATAEDHPETLSSSAP